MDGAKKKRKMKNRGSAGDDGKGKKSVEASRLSFSLPSVPRTLLFLFSPGFVRLLVTSPHASPYEKIKEASVEERGLGRAGPLLINKFISQIS